MKNFTRLGLALALGLLVACSDQRLEIESPEEYYKEIDKDKALVYFYKEDCKYCHVFEPFLEEVIKDTKAKVYYYDVDANEKYDENPQIMEEVGVGTVPRLVSYKDGQVDEAIDHMNTKADIYEFIDLEVGFEESTRPSHGYLFPNGLL